MDHVEAAQVVQVELDANRRCAGGVSTRLPASSVPLGPSGGPEVLALLHLEQVPSERFWYGHPEHAGEIMARAASQIRDALNPDIDGYRTVDSSAARTKEDDVRRGKHLDL